MIRKIIIKLFPSIVYDEKTALKAIKNLNPKELRTFYLHVIFSIIDGMIRGALLLNEYVFIKSLNGSSYQIRFLFQSSVVVL